MAVETEYPSISLQGNCAKRDNFRKTWDEDHAGMVTDLRDHPAALRSYPTAFAPRCGRTQLARGKWQV